ncbi:MAG: hypothetical protein DHS20C18_07010 [Saprospiraceae bacterium]|nr:MAG: hypothetical protein DHS20C18_07010 [Saprospiraceae bacterium]
MIKEICILIVLLAFANNLLAQVSGNVNYQNQIHFSDKDINVNLPSNSDLMLEVRGLSNVEADAYVAIFSLTQIGETADAVNSLMDERINNVEKSVKAKPEVTFFVDMISFVPVYEYEVEKKVFSKKTYNEIPQGFELKKNLHIQYTDPDFLEELITICAQSEIYDLVKVDYVADSLEQKKRELSSKAKTLMDEKLKHYQEILGTDLTVFEKNLADGFSVFYPVEMYRSYQAFSNASLNLKKPATVNTASKSTTQYYQPIIDKSFDFVINPIIVEPVIQVLYELKVSIKREKVVTPEPKKEYLLITPTGEVKKLEIGN